MDRLSLSVMESSVCYFRCSSSLSSSSDLILLPENQHRTLPLLASSSRGPNEAERSKRFPIDLNGLEHGSGRDVVIFLRELA